MRKFLLLLPLLASCRPAEPPEKVVEAFYGEQFIAPISGAPDSAELARLRPYISDSLAILLAAAAAQREADIARAPNERPAWVDGDIFASLFEGPAAFSLNAGIADGKGFKVPVAFQYRPAFLPATSEQHWADTAVVVVQRGKWVVSDVIYGGTWDFAQKGTLVGALQGRPQ